MGKLYLYLSWSDGKRPDGLTLIPWQAGTQSSDKGHHCRLPVSRIVRRQYGSAGAEAEVAAAHNTAKYATLESHYVLQPIAMESVGPINVTAVSLLSVLGRRIAGSR